MVAWQDVAALSMLQARGRDSEKRPLVEEDDDAVEAKEEEQRDDNAATCRNNHRRKRHAKYFRDRQNIALIATEHVDDYRKAVETLVHDEDIALEVGCAGGKTTAVLGRKARLAYGVDKSFSPAMLEEQHSYTNKNTKFLQMDAMDIGVLQQLSREAAQEASVATTSGFTVILIDISGSAKLSAVLDLIERYETVFSDSLRLLIVKSYRLACLLDRAKPFMTADI